MMSAVERGFLATQIHAKYPIDKWEEEGAPFVSEEGWCELVMRVAKNKLDTLEAVFQAAKQTQTRLRHARGVKGDDVEDLRPRHACVACE